MNELNKRRNTQSDSVKADVLVDDWRFRFRNAMSKFSVRGEAFNALCNNDSYYSTKDGLYDWVNVRANRAGIVATSRVVIILERHLDDKSSKKTYLKKIKAKA